MTASRSSPATTPWSATSTAWSTAGPSAVAARRRGARRASTSRCSTRPTTPRARPPTSRRTCASSGCACAPDAVATSSQAGAWLLADRLARGQPGAGRRWRRGGHRPRERPGCAPCCRADGRAATRGGRRAAGLRTGGDRVRPGGGGLCRRGWRHLGRHEHRRHPARPTGGWLRGTARWSAAVRARVGPPSRPRGRQAGARRSTCSVRTGSALPVGRVLAVGDRLDTDIEGAVAAGMDSLLVLTGVDDLAACLEAPPQRARPGSRPTCARCSGTRGGDRARRL